MRLFLETIQIISPFGGGFSSNSKTCAWRCRRSCPCPRERKQAKAFTVGIHLRADRVSDEAVLPSLCQHDYLWVSHVFQHRSLPSTAYWSLFWHGLHRCGLDDVLAFVFCLGPFLPLSTVFRRQCLPKVPQFVPVGVFAGPARRQSKL